MNEAQSLDALAKVLNDLSERPYDITLHAQHIRLAHSMGSMETEVQSALEMLPDFLAAGEDVWLSLIKAKETASNLESAQDVEELLALYNRAEGDYLCASFARSKIRALTLHLSYSHPSKTLTIHP